MNNKWIRPTVWSIVMAGLIALMGWNLSATANMPKEYATKEEVRNIADDVDHRQTRIEDKLDDIKKTILELHTKLRGGP